jgi:hypothetical protein
MDSINHKKTKPKSRRQPDGFRESLAPTMPMAPGRLMGEPDELVVGADTPVRTDWLRYGLYLVWALAAVTAGIGVGIMLNSSRLTITQEPPVPVATMTLAVAADQSAGGVVKAATPAQPDLKVAPGSSVPQAQAGNPFEVMSATTYQPATASQLQPGYTPAGLPQGNLGIAAVR